LRKTFGRVQRGISKGEKKQLRNLVLVLGVTWVFIVAVKDLFLQFVTWLGIIAEPGSVTGNLLTALLAFITLMLIYYFFDLE
jgi:hypothetical protein